jgi:hypothetical protein
MGARIRWAGTAKPIAVESGQGFKATGKQGSAKDIPGVSHVFFLKVREAADFS